MFNIQLSVSTEIPTDKKSAGRIVQFEIKNFQSDSVALTELFTTRNYSTNQWKDGKCKNINYTRMSGVTIDVDQGYSMVDAKEIFKDFNYIIHTSTSHKANDSRKGGVQDRYRIILPFTLPTTVEEAQYLNTPEAAKSAYQYLETKYPFMDSSCSDPGRKYYPFLNKDYPGLFEIYINDTGKYFLITQEDINSVVAKKPIIGGDKDSYSLYLNDEIVLKNKTKMKLKDILDHTDCYCPVCDDLKSDSASGLVNVLPDGRRNIFCFHCDRTYWVSLEELFPDIFYIGKELVKVDIQNGDVAVDRVPKEDYFDIAPDAKKKFLHIVATKRRIPSSNFSITKMVDAYSDSMKWKLNIQESSVDVWIPPIPVQIKDNRYINTWLEKTFEGYTEFIKDWVAIWTHANHQGLPMLVFNGERGVGKTTFGAFLQSIYPKLTSEWNGQDHNFTDYLDSKLLIIEEANTDKKEQYDRIKKVSGEPIHTVNRKFMIPYQKKNNTSMVLITNAFSPLYLDHTEIPPGPDQNQFFMITFKRQMSLNSKIKEELAERSGYYVRTELRERYEMWANSPIGKENRYGIPCPLTPLLISQYSGAKSNVDYDVERIYQACVYGEAVLKDGIAIDRVGPFDVVSAADLYHIALTLKLQTRNVRTIREKMQKYKHLSDGDNIKKNRLDAWRVLKPVEEKESS
jgi:hypothetical protein